MSQDQSQPPPARPARSSAERILTWAVFIVILGGAFLLVLPVFQQERNGRRSPCKNNLKQIGLALMNYHDVHGSYPPAITYGPDGKPWHSWRILLAPFLEQQEVHARYRFDEPWNSPHNRQLAAGVGTPSVFHCPHDKDAARGTTSYVAVIGEGTMWPPHGVTTHEDAKDGGGNTLQVVEVSDSGVHWMEPKDLRLDAMTFAIGADKGVGIRGRHGGAEHGFAKDEPSFATVSAVDGHVRAIGYKTPPETVRSLLLRDDGGPADF